MISIIDSTSIPLCNEEYIDSTTTPNNEICENFKYQMAGYYFKPPVSSLQVRDELTNSWLDDSYLNSILTILETTALVSEIASIQSETSRRLSLEKITEVSSEIRELSEKDVHFNKILANTLTEVDFILDKDGINYRIRVEIEEDIEIPEWKEFLILIQISITNHKELVQLWRKISENVRNKIESIKSENEILREYKNFTIILEEI